MKTPTRKAALTAAQWQAILDVRSELSDEERSIVRLLAEGKTQAAVGAELGMHRSVVWRKANAISSKHGDNA